MIITWTTTFGKICAFVSTIARLLTIDPKRVSEQRGEGGQGGGGTGIRGAGDGVKGAGDGGKGGGGRGKRGWGTGEEGAGVGNFWGRGLYQNLLYFTDFILFLCT